MANLILITFAILSTVFVCPSSGQSTIEPLAPTTPTVAPPITEAPTNNCYTVTTSGPSCSQASCPLPACLKLSTITQSCGCPSIYTAYSCTNSCTNNCAGTSYITLYLPCPTIPPSPPSTSSSEPTSTLASSSSSDLPTSTETPSSSSVTSTSSYPEPSATAPSYRNSTTTTTTVTPGGEGTATSEVITSPVNTGPRPSSSLVEANVADRVWLAEAGVFAGLIAAVFGML